MNSPDKDRATVVRWTWGSRIKAIADATQGRSTGEKRARRFAKSSGRSPWRITITVERMPNEETGK
jgi:hypothetical protein